MRKFDDSVAYADNWRVVLAVDACVGVGAAAAGVVFILLASWAIGVALVVFGCAYFTAVAMRARRWSGLRRKGWDEASADSAGPR